MHFCKIRSTKFCFLPRFGILSSFPTFQSCQKAASFSLVLWSHLTSVTESIIYLLRSCLQQSPNPDFEADFSLGSNPEFHTRNLLFSGFLLYVVKLAQVLVTYVNHLQIPQRSNATIIPVKSWQPLDNSRRWEMMKEFKILAKNRIWLSGFCINAYFMISR